MLRIKPFGDAVGIFVGSLIVVSVLLILTEILLRSIFSKTIYITDEYCGYLMAVISFWGLFYGDINDDHIKINIIEGLKNKRALKIIQKMQAIFGLVFSLYLSYVLFLLFQESLKYNSVSLQVSETPLVVPQFILIPGALLLALAYFKRIVEG